MHDFVQWRTKILSITILSGVPQATVLGPVESSMSHKQKST